jgi:hypothetical protein
MIDPIADMLTRIRQREPCVAAGGGIAPLAHQGEHCADPEEGRTADVVGMARPKIIKLLKYRQKKHRRIARHHLDCAAMWVRLRFPACSAAGVAVVSTSEGLMTGTQAGPKSRWRIALLHLVRIDLCRVLKTN